MSRRESGGGARYPRATAGDYLRDPIKATYKDRRSSASSIRQRPPKKRLGKKRRRR